MNPRIVHLRVKIKSLASESKDIRVEEKRAIRAAHWKKGHEGGDFDVAPYQSLFFHRKGLVGPLARINLLAYAFLRDVPYATAEQKTRKCPDFRQVFKIVKSFGTAEDIGRWSEWQAAAVKHLHEQKLYPNVLSSDEMKKEAA